MAAHGSATREKTNQGGNSKGTCIQRSVSPPATGHRALVTGHWPTGHLSTSHRPFAQWTRRHHRPATSHRSPVNGHWPPVKWALQNFQVSQ